MVKRSILGWSFFFLLRALRWLLLVLVFASARDRGACLTEIPRAEYKGVRVYKKKIIYKIKMIKRRALLGTVD